MDERAQQLPTAKRPWLLWDGGCGFCGACVRWLRRRDSAGRLRTLPWQRCPNPPMDAELEAICRRSVVLLRGAEGRLAGGRAVLAALELIGWRPRLIRFARRRPFVWLVIAGYRLVASQRGRLGRWFGEE